MDLETLWYLVLGVSVLMYSILDGFDLGVGCLHLFAKGDQQRRLFLNAIGPVWDGNEVWIVIVMGGLFAGFPGAYASLFSGFYTLLMFLIAGLIFRAVSIEFRSKKEGELWRSFWDVAFSLSSILIALLLGLLIGNLIEGVSLDSSQNYVGTFADFFRPYSLLISCLAGATFALHGSIYLLVKLEGSAYQTVRSWIFLTSLSFLLFYLVATGATLFFKPYMIERFQRMPALGLLPLLNFLCIALMLICVKREKHPLAFLFSSLNMAMLFALFCLGTYPVIVQSNLSPDLNSLTIYNTASSEGTLKILMTVVIIGVPLVLAYGFWIYRIFRGKVKLDHMIY